MVDQATADNKAVAYALAQVGKPYVFGAAGPDAFDCSGLTQQAYKRAGITLVHYTISQWNHFSVRGQLIPVSQSYPGCLIFYGSGRNGAFAYHVAMDLGGGQLIEAPDVGIPVRVRSWSPSDPDLAQQVGAYLPRKGGRTVGGALGVGDINVSSWPSPSSFHAPLSKSQRTKLINAILAAEQASGSHIASKSFLEGEKDQPLIDLYTTIYQVVQGKPPPRNFDIPGTGTLNDVVNGTAGLIGKLTDANTWVRVAEFAVGGVLLGVAVNGALKGRR